MTCTTTCNLGPFRNPVTAQDPVTSDSINLLAESIESYLALLQESVCADLRCLDDFEEELGLDPESPIEVYEVDIDIPSVGSNGSFSTDLSAPNVELGDAILAWAPLTNATSLDDLLIQWFVPLNGTVRFTADNPSSGAVNPDPIRFQFVVGRFLSTPETTTLASVP